MESSSLKLDNFRLKLDNFHTYSSTGFRDKISSTRYCTILYDTIVLCTGTIPIMNGEWHNFILDVRSSTFRHDRVQHGYPFDTICT